METVESILMKIKSQAQLLYPPEIYNEYLNLEYHYFKKNKKEVQNCMSLLQKLKDKFSKAVPEVNWSSFLERIRIQVEQNRKVFPRDIVLLEKTPEEFTIQIKDIARILCERRNAADQENIRVCQSIYGFTTCTEPCTYGTYGSCLFAAREGKSISLAEKIFGNITTSDEFYNEVKGCTESNNRKLISTSHQASDEILKVIEEAICKIRQDKDGQVPICVSLGSLDEDQIISLRNAGMTRVNHNLETSYFNSIYLSALALNNGHDTDFNYEYEKRLKTLVSALNNKIRFCSGGMLFYGDDELVEDRVLLYLTFRELDAIHGLNSSPFNVYVPLKEIVDESMGWFNSFNLPAVERKAIVPKFSILKSLISFALIVPPEHKIVVSAGSKWLENYYPLAVELGGGAGLANYLQQVPSDKTLNVVEAIRSKALEQKSLSA